MNKTTYKILKKMIHESDLDIERDKKRLFLRMIQNKKILDSKNKSIIKGL